MQEIFKYALERYQDRKSEAENKCVGNDIQSAYNKGKVDAFDCIIKDLESWNDIKSIMSE